MFMKSRHGARASSFRGAASIKWICSQNAGQYYPQRSQRGKAVETIVQAARTGKTGDGDLYLSGRGCDSDPHGGVAKRCSIPMTSMSGAAWLDDELVPYLTGRKNPSFIDWFCILNRED
jgi:hypothetical protein